jgi:hypothetical protein
MKIAKAPSVVAVLGALCIWCASCGSQQQKPMAAQKKATPKALNPKSKPERAPLWFLDPPVVVSLSKISKQNRAGAGSTYKSFSEVALSVNAQESVAGRLVTAATMRSFKASFVSVDDGGVDRPVTVYKFTRKNSWHVRFVLPIISPDRSFIALRDQSSGYSATPLWILNTETGKCSQVPVAPFRYAFVSWSPDSRYLAYVRGGSSRGGLLITEAGETIYGGPLELVVCDWRAGKEFLVATSDSLSGPFHWTGAHTLVYGLQAAPDKVNGNPKSKIAPRPDVYKFSPDTQQSRLLFKDGYHPVPSPDGEWIAFYGSPNPQQPVRLARDPVSYNLENEWRFVSKGASLCLAKPDGTERIALQPYNGFYPQIRWLSDNRRFVTVEHSRSDSKSQGKITLWDRQTQSMRPIATLHAKVSPARPSTLIRPQFKIMGISKDDRQMFVLVEEVIETTQENHFLHTLKKIDLQSREVTTVSRITRAMGVDWRPAE